MRVHKAGLLAGTLVAAILAGPAMAQDRDRDGPRPQRERGMQVNREGPRVPEARPQRVAPPERAQARRIETPEPRQARVETPRQAETVQQRMIGVIGRERSGDNNRDSRRDQGHDWNNRDRDGRDGDRRDWDRSRDRNDNRNWDRNRDRKEDWRDRDKDRDRDRWRDNDRNHDGDRDRWRDNDRHHDRDRDRWRDNDRNHDRDRDRWRDHNRRPVVIVRPSPTYRYRPHWWGQSYFSFDNRYYGHYDYGSWYRPGYGFYGSQYGSGWAVLDPWLRQDPAAKHWVMWNFDRNRNGQLSKDEARRANREFARLADRNRDGYLNDGEIRFGVEELRDEYRYSFNY
ncbi:hypothetical protein [Sphingosinicella sp.]|uniref:hypothetical protein n=1 Tax=Sphingosinicella sp. TaxID=1917971 RepID=UPI0017D7429C|nr:hypothetical protein [Sphingosinicella sp.]MBA4757387.1 hypothetical protein [Sphingosinicella sp.]